MYKRLAVAFTGPSNSGKTTLIQKVATKLIAQDYKVVIIKNDPKDKAKFDIEGKDSYKFYSTGADVIVTSPTRTTYFSQNTREMDSLIELAKEFDYLLVEGLKTLPLPRIAIFRGELNSDYYDVSDVLAVDDSIDKEETKELNTLDLNNTQQIIEWIDKNSKKV
jgi:molybdopterin-guanine dinucleotide biosynthesis protein B